MPGFKNSRFRRHGLATAFAVLFSLNLCPAQTQQVIRFDGGRSDHARALTRDSAGNLYVAGAVEDAAVPCQFAVVKYNAAGSLQWVSHYQGAPDQQFGSAAAVATDAAGNVYAAGHLQRNLGVFVYNIDWLVVSFDPSGVQRWSHVINGADDGYDQAVALALDPAGAVYVSGISGLGNNLDWLTVKYSLDGTVQWQRTVSGAVGGDDRPAAARLDAAGDLVVLGYTSNLGVGLARDLSVVKYDRQGNVLWGQDYSDSAVSDEFPADLAVDQGGNVYVTGLIQPFDPESGSFPVLLKYDASGAPVFALTGEGFGGTSVVVGPDGNLVVAGTTVGEVGSFVRSSVSKLTPQGAVIWTTPVAADSQAAVAPDGSVLAGGTRVTPVGFDFFASKLAADGVPVWTQFLTDGKFVNDILLGDGGDFFITGDSEGSLPDMLTVRFSEGAAPPPVPAAPTGLTLSAGRKTLTLRWVDLAVNETGFRIERSINGSGFVEIARAGANAQSYTDGGLNKQNTYAYRVRAFNGSGNSPYSNTASGKPK